MMRFLAWLRVLPCRYNILFPMLSERHASVFPAAVFTKRHWRWAYCAYTSRVFPEAWVRSSDAAPGYGCSPHRGLFDRARGPGGAFLPVVDLFNHYPGPVISGNFVDWSSPLQPTRKKVAAGGPSAVPSFSVLVGQDQVLNCGREVFNHYGARDTAAWILKYGFVPTIPEQQINPAAAVSVSLAPDACEKATAGISDERAMCVLAALKRQVSSMTVAFTSADLQSTAGRRQVALLQSLVRTARICVADPQDVIREQALLPERASMARLFSSAPWSKPVDECSLNSKAYLKLFDHIDLQIVQSAKWAEQVHHVRTTSSLTTSALRNLLTWIMEQQHMWKLLRDRLSDFARGHTIATVPSKRPRDT